MKKLDLNIADGSKKQISAKDSKRSSKKTSRTKAFVKNSKQFEIEEIEIEDQFQERIEILKLQKTDELR